MKTPRVLTSSVALCLGFLLMAALWMVPAKVMAVDTTSPIVGTWEGTVDPGVQAKKRIVVHITAGQDGILTGTIDYPDQDTSGILMTAITFQQGVLHFESSSTLVTYTGSMSKDRSEIDGTWTQGESKLTLNLKRTA
jgi:hypothetical protein